jgi:sulfur carrier protein
VRAFVNGDEWELADGTTVADVLRELGAPETGIAVACRGEVVRRADWPATPVHDGDEIDVLTAVQGG